MKTERIPEPILVTGATGFIGRRLIQRLRDDGYRPRAFVLPDTTPPDNWGADVEIARGDVTHYTSVAAAVRGARTVFHLAAVVGDWGPPEQHRRVTVVGTENVLTEAAREGARVMLASSVVVYGEAIRTEICDEDRALGQPLGRYSLSKQAQEKLARRLEGTDGLKVTVIRPTNVYGPGCAPWVDMPVAELQRGSPMLIDGGRRTAGLTYVDNVVDVFIRAAERPGAVGRIYNASDDNGITWLRYFTELAELCGAKPPKSIPGIIARAAARGLETGFRIARRTERPPITREALNLVGSHHRIPITRAIQELGYSPPVGYQAGMRAVADYLKEKQA